MNGEDYVNRQADRGFDILDSQSAVLVSEVQNDGVGRWHEVQLPQDLQPVIEPRMLGMSMPHTQTPSVASSRTARTTSPRPGEVSKMTYGNSRDSWFTSVVTWRA